MSQVKNTLRRVATKPSTYDLWRNLIARVGRHQLTQSPIAADPDETCVQVKIPNLLRGLLRGTDRLLCSQFGEWNGRSR